MSFPVSWSHEFSRRRPESIYTCSDRELFSTLKMSSSNSSSVSSLHGSNGVKNTVCRLVFFLFQHRWVPRPGFVLNEYPRWNGNPFHSNGIATWPINSDAITSPPVCPWNARIYNRSSQEFLQYWNRVLLLPFQIWMIQSKSEKVSPPSFRNVHRSFEPIDFQ